MNKLQSNYFNTNNTGGYGDDYYDDVLLFDASSQTWIKVGTLQQTRSDHSMTIVNQEEINAYCN